MVDGISGDTRAKRSGQVSGGTGPDDAKKADSTPTLDELAVKNDEAPAATYAGVVGGPRSAKPADALAQSGAHRPMHRIDPAHLLKAATAQAAKQTAPMLAANALAIEGQGGKADATDAQVAAKLRAAADKATAAGDKLARGDAPGGLDDLGQCVDDLHAASGQLEPHDAALSQEVSHTAKEVADDGVGVVEGIYQYAFGDAEDAIRALQALDSASAKLELAGGEGLRGAAAGTVTIERTEDGRYRSTVEAELDVGVGANAAGDAGEAEAKLGVKVAVETLASTPEEAVANAAKLALLTSPAAVAALMATGDLGELADDVTKVSFTGAFAAELEGKLSKKAHQGGDFGVSASAKLEGEAENTVSLLLDRGRITGFESTQRLTFEGRLGVGIVDDGKVVNGPDEGFGGTVQGAGSGTSLEVTRTYASGPGGSVSFSDFLGAGGSYATGGMFAPEADKTELRVSATGVVGTIEHTVEVAGPVPDDVGAVVDAVQKHGLSPALAKELGVQGTYTQREVAQSEAGFDVGFLEASVEMDVRKVKERTPYP